jgi:hypothetical protein
MKTYLAIYLGTADGMANWKAMDEETRKQQEKAGVTAWKKWVTDNKASIVADGAPLGKTKRIDNKGVSDTRNEMTAYTLVQAESHEAAARLFVNHPHFTIFPGERIEVMECLPIPAMS